MGAKITEFPELNDKQRKLAEQYYPMVAAIEKRHERRIRNRGITQADLQGCTHVSYIRAIARISADSNPQQIRAYLSQVLNGAVVDHIRKSTHIPRNKIADVHKLRNYMAEHSKAEDAEICAELGWTQRYLRKVRLVEEIRESSIDRMNVSQTDGTLLPLQEVIPDWSSLRELKRYEIREHIAWLFNVARLSEKERYVLKRYYFVGEIQTEIAKALGVSGARVAQIMKTGIEKLRAVEAQGKRTTPKIPHQSAKFVSLIRRYYQLLLKARRCYRKLLAC